MKRVSRLTLVFALLTVVFVLLLVFLRFPFPLYRLISYQDAFDLLTPLVLIPIYWLLLRRSGTGASLGEEIAFMVLAALWVEGQGLHLAANSIDNLIEGLAKSGGIDVTGTTIYTLTYFLDEHLSHYMWHLGMVGLAALLIYHEWRRPAGEATAWGTTIAAGIVYGVACWIFFLEGQTVPLGLASAAAVTVFGLVWGRKKLGQRPVLAFFFVACLFALVAIVAWWAYFGHPVEFMDGIGMLFGGQP